MRKSSITFLILIISVVSPIPARASYLTLPIDVDPVSDISAWFDHNSSGGSFLRHDGDTTDNYDGHNGTDFATSTGADVLAPADGEVEEVYWDNCGGWQMHLWHDDIGLSTLYSHLSTTTSATTTDLVLRGDRIADVGNTGSCSTGPHLHFGVTDGVDRTTSNRIDPFGWSGGGSDPWIYDLGYLWTTNPPVFSNIWSENFDSYTDGDLSTQGGWVGDTVYDIQGVNVHTGAKAVKSNGSSGSSIRRNFSQINLASSVPFILSGYYMSSDSTITGGSVFLSLVNETLGIFNCTLKRNSFNDIVLQRANSTSTTTPNVVVGAWTGINVWTNYRIEFDGTNCRARIGNSAWSSTITMGGPLATSSPSVYIPSVSSTEDNAYYDSFSIVRY